jgi:hypothetical protein
MTTHVTSFHHLVLSVVDLVDTVGAPDALATLRSERPALDEHGYHDTRAVFLVWAVERLRAAGLSPTAVLWHPLVHTDSVLAWYDAATLDSAAARETFVPSTLALPGEPAPHEPAPCHLTPA